jgi:MIP family channel proteins
VIDKLFPRRIKVGIPLFACLSSGEGAEKQENPRQQRWQRTLLAEALGTFLLVQLGTGAVMSSIFTDSMKGLFQIAAVWIIGVTVAISSTAAVSGAHLNPAITVSMALFRDFEWSKVFPYCLSQLTGAIAAAWVSLTLFAGPIQQFEVSRGIVRHSNNAIASARAFGSYFEPPITTATAFFAEVYGTAVLSAVIFALTQPRNEEATKNKGALVPALIGTTVGALICGLGPLTQAALNPARDLGPRIVAWTAGWHRVAFRQAWVYFTAPFVGAPLGAALVDKILYSKETDCCG